VIWESKCLRLGWFLRYKPPDWEFGAWKRHFGGCVKTFDYSSSSDKVIYLKIKQKTKNSILLEHFQKLILIM
jgi:hypothetical protein